MRITSETIIPVSKPTPVDLVVHRSWPKETAWRAFVARTFTQMGWMVYWTWNSLHSPAGFPDLVLVGPGWGRTIFAELKTERGTVSAAQREWLRALSRKNEVFIWWPSDQSEILDLIEAEFNGRSER